MSEREHLLAAICANPEEDTPRLAFADWLDEQGGDGNARRAAFIRAQIRLAPLPRYHPDWLPAAHAILRTWGPHLLEWRTELPLLAGIHWGEFRRGFVETVGVSSPGNLVQKGAWVASSAPLLGIALNGRDHLAALALSPVFARIRRLRLAHGRTLHDDALRELLGLPNFPRLTHLDLSTEQIGIDGASAIAACERLAGLTELNLSENGIGDPGLTALARSPHLTNLRVLNLAGNVTARSFGVCALAGSPVAARLEELHLGPCGGPAGARALAASQHLTRLLFLSLACHTLDPEDMRALAGSPNFAGLVALRLRVAMGSVDAEAIARSPHLRGLRDLSILMSHIGDAGAAALASSPNLSGLRRLNLSSNGLTDAGARALAASPHLDGLREGRLFLGVNPGITRAGVAALRDRFGYDPTALPPPDRLPDIIENVRF